MAKLLSMKEYLSNPFQDKTLSLSDNDNLSFHWADFAESCEIFKERMQTNKNGVYEKLLSKLEGYKKTDVWVKGRQRVHTLNLYTIYDCLVLNKKIPEIDKGKEDVVEVSFMGPGGPYKKISLGECLNADSYSQFVFHRLLTEQIPMRDFRLRCKGSIACNYHHVYSRSLILEITQLTSEGILFISQDKNIKKKMAQTDEIKLLIDIDVFKEGLKMSLNEIKNNFSKNDQPFYTQDDRCEYKLATKDIQFFEGYDSQAKGITYIFCRFEDIHGHNELFSEILKSFTDHMRGEIGEHVKAA